MVNRGWEATVDTSLGVERAEQVFSFRRVVEQGATATPKTRTESPSSHLEGSNDRDPRRASVRRARPAHRPSARGGCAAPVGRLRFKDLRASRPRM